MASDSVDSHSPFTVKEGYCFVKDTKAIAKLPIKDTNNKIAFYRRRGSLSVLFIKKNRKHLHNTPYSFFSPF